MIGWNNYLCSNFCDLHWVLIFCNKWHPGTSGISTPLKIAVGTHFHAQNGTETIPVLLNADKKSLRPRSLSLLSGNKVQPENTYSYFVMVTGLVWKNQEMLSININHSYHLTKSNTADLMIRHSYLSIKFNPFQLLQI